MNRPRRPLLILPGSAPLLAGALLACVMSAPERPPQWPPPAWARRPPAGCAVGFSGPTLDPGDAIRQARRAALEGLAAAWLGVRVVSELHLHGRGSDEWSLQETRGILQRSRIVALSVGPDGAGYAGRPLREVFALACPADLPVPVAAPAGQPTWLLEVPNAAGRSCVHGVGGPTRRPGGQDAAALRDGRRALAKAIEIRIRQRSFDNLRGPLRVVSDSQASTRALEVSSRVDELEARWTDERGRGPLRTAGVVYGLVCTEA
ncbi:MAG: hypothetical protein JRE70_05460 [Deltaproteobacteria bacterium]|nr:hypothetical protein [Deltaproteobacteria bacterium]